MNSSTPLWYVDLETTGLNPQEDHVLEIAVAESTLENPYEYTHTFHTVFPFKGRSIDMCKIDPFVLAMHSKSGLWLECANGKRIYKGYDNQPDVVGTIDYPEALRLLKRYFSVRIYDLNVQANKNGLPPVKITIGGSSVHFDMDFLKVLFSPDTDNCLNSLSHRHFDVSAIKLFCKSKGMPDIPKGEAHRAKDDIVESIAHLKLCDEWLRDHYRGVSTRLSAPVEQPNNEHVCGLSDGKGTAKIGDMVTVFTPQLGASFEGIITKGPSTFRGRNHDDEIKEITAASIITMAGDALKEKIDDNVKQEFDLVLEGCKTCQEYGIGGGVTLTGTGVMGTGTKMFTPEFEQTGSIQVSDSPPTNFKEEVNTNLETAINSVLNNNGKLILT